MKRTITVALALAFSGLACASDDQDLVALSGFGTFGATRGNDAAIGYRYPFQKNTHPDNWATDMDSRIAAQLDYNKGGKFSGVAQVVGIQRFQGSFKPDLEWFNASWQINDQWRTRVGRMVTPIFMQSDSQNVGYSLIPARYALEMSNVYPVTRHDGADLLYNTQVGEGNLQIQGFAGHTRYKAPTSEYKADLILGATSTYSRGPYTLRGSFTSVDVKIVGSAVSGLNAIAAGLAANGCSGCADEAERFRKASSGFNTKFYALGASYDEGPWYGQVEYVLRKGEAIASDGHGFVLLGAYRYKNLTPYVSYSRQKNDKPGAPDSVAAVPIWGAAANSSYQSGDVSRKTKTVGVRWDFAKNIDLKLQAEFMKHDHPTNSMAGVTPVISGKTYDGKVAFYTVTIDYIF